MCKINNLKKFRVPKFVKYDFMLHKYENSDFSLKYFGVEENIYQDIIDFDIIKDNHKNLNYSDAFVIHKYLINKYFEENEYNIDFKSLIFNNIFFENNFEYLNVTNICRKYNISGFDVFYKLISRYNISKEKAMEDFTEDSNKTFDNNYVHFDYYNNIGIKNSFPKDEIINTKNFKLNMRRYNDRENYQGYNLILELFCDKIKENKINDKYTDIIKLHLDKKDDLNINKNYCNEKKINEINKIIKLEGNIEDINKHYNWRARVYDEKMDISKYELEEIYNKKIKNNLKELDITNYFDFVKGKFIPKYNLHNELRNISMINILLFSKTRINTESLLDLLEFVRIKYVKSYDETIILDNYKVSHMFVSSPKYSSIEFVDFDEIDSEYKFPKSIYDKHKVIKFIKTIFYEFRPETINYHNYNVIYNHYQENDMNMMVISNIINREEHRLDDIRKENK